MRNAAMQARKAVGDTPAFYPTFPSHWPNRQVRRAVKQNKLSKLPNHWSVFILSNPAYHKELRSLI